MNLVVCSTVGEHNCDSHPKAPAAKQVLDASSGKFHYLCISCCEDLAQRLIFGLTPDPVELQHEQEYDL